MAIKSLECIKDLFDTEQDNRIYSKGVFYTFNQKKGQEYWQGVDDTGTCCILSEYTLKEYFNG